MIEAERTVARARREQPEDRDRTDHALILSAGAARCGNHRQPRRSVTDRRGPPFVPGMELDALILGLTLPELTRVDSLVHERLTVLAGDRGPALTPRQRQVAELVGFGCTNGEIAKMLAISANAVKKHVSRLLQLLEASNRTELATTLAKRAA
jgi:DNA-binding CsgD family transcriptional regulator